MDLAFVAKVRKLFEDDLINDILFVITYGGTTAPWPGQI